MVALHSPWRWPTAALLLLIAAVHVPLIGDHLEEAPYVGWLFIPLASCASLLAVAVLVADAPASGRSAAPSASRPGRLPGLADGRPAAARRRRRQLDRAARLPGRRGRVACAAAAAAVLRRARARTVAHRKVFQ